MSRDIDSRSFDRDAERPDVDRGARTNDPVPVFERADPREIFARAVDLPRGPARERVDLHGRSYQLRGSDVRMLASVGAFRAIPAHHLRDHHGREARAHSGDLHHLRRAGLVQTRTAVLDGRRTTLVTLTRSGRQLLEAHRTRDAHQRFYAGGVRHREATHDAQAYRAYLDAANRIDARGARVDRVLLEAELKRDYQEFLQAGNRDRPDSDGRPTQTGDAIEAWAEAHTLPFFDDHVHFPDLRIEYEWADGSREYHDVEIMTPHYRGAHFGDKVRAGFSPFDPGVAEEFV